MKSVRLVSLLSVFLVPLAVACADSVVLNVDGPLDSATAGVDGGTLRFLNGNIVLVIPAGALAEPITFAVRRTSEHPGGPTVVPNGVVEIGPSGTTFDKPVLLRAKYTEEALPGGVLETDVGLYTVVNGAWQLNRTSTVDTAANKVEAEISDLSTFGLVGAQPDDPPPPPNVGEPEYDASNPDHVLHAFEDWSTYSTPADIPTTNRVDGGGPWQTGGTAFQTFTGNPDPWFGTKTLTIDYQDAPPAGQSLGRGLILVDVNNQYLNRNADKESLVIEWAWRWAGTGPYVGKIADWQPAPGIDRFNYQSGRDRLGAQIDNTCDNDPLCSLYYSNGGSQPLFEGLLPTSTSRGGALARSRFDVTHFYIQNRNWGNGPGQVNWGGASDDTHGINLVDDTWRRTILRLTRNQNGLTGFGRFEEWLQKAGESAVKVMEYIGDVGGFDEGLVFSRNEAVGGATWIAGGALLDLYTLTAPAGIFNGGSTVHVGFIRIWSHPRDAP